MTLHYPSIRNLNFARRGVIYLALSLLLFPPLWAGQATVSKPITKNGLLHALQIGGLSEKELVEQVKHRGVDFAMTKEVAAELRKAGADEALIRVIRDNYAPDGEAVRSQKENGSPAQQTPATPPPPAPPAPVAAPTALQPDSSNRTQASSAKSPSTLREVHKLFIDTMPNNLDGYLRAAISQKLTAYMSIVLDRRDADAILQSTAPGAVSIVDQSGKVLLWSGSADDKEMLYLNFRHGGQKELADKLAGQLKKALK